MPSLFTFTERPNSRTQSRAARTIEYVYLAAGEQDDLIVYNYAKNTGTPAAILTSWGLLYRQDIRLSPNGYAMYVVTVPYGPFTREVDEATFSFDSTGGIAHITAAKEHVADYAHPDDDDGNDLNPHKGTIGVTQRGEVEGCDIIVPALKMTYGIRKANGVVDEAFARLMARYTGSTNHNAWRGFDAKTLLFMGATGSDGRQAEAEVQYHVLANHNETGQTIGEIVGIAKRAHEYVWVAFRSSKTDEGKAATRPLRVFVERVYDSFDFASVLGLS